MKIIQAFVMLLFLVSCSSESENDPAMKECMESYGNQDVCNEMLSGENENIAYQDEIDMSQVIKLRTERRRNVVTHITNQLSRILIVTSLQDEVIVKDVVANRGKCDLHIIKYIYNPEKRKSERAEFPIKLGFSEDVEFRMSSNCNDLLEVRVSTNYGDGVWVFD